MIQKIVPVILCGGSGTRLRPLSSDEKPKQFLRLIDEHSLLQNTAIRAMNVADVTANEIVTVTLNNMQSKIIDDYNEIDAGLCGHILSEPSAKNTAAAVALAADESALKTSLECAVNAALIAVISSNPQWSDIGSWQSLYELKTKEGFLKLIENFSEEEQSKIFNSINQKMDQAA